MQTEHLRFGGGVAHTVVNPMVLLVMVLATILMCLLPRRYIIVPFLAAIFLIPMDQVIVMGPFHFYVLRVALLVGWIRMLWAKSSSGLAIFSGGMNAIDKAVICGTLISAVDFVILWGAAGAVINQLGMLYTVLGSYMFLRFLVRNEEDLNRVIRVFAYIAILIAVMMVFEQKSGQSLFSLLGGSGGLAPLGARNRPMASFAGPILAGTFGAVLLPLFVGLWLKSHESRFIALMGIVASTVITITSASSTPVFVYLAGVGALCLWPVRRQMRLIRWGAVLSLFGLQMVMKAPVWALIARSDVIAGSSGYHRYMLVDQFIRRFGDWWLIGTKVNAHWGWDMWDLANQYVAVGEVSGVLPLIFFLLVIIFGFKYLGIARKTYEGTKKSECFVWAMGAALFSNVVAFFGISYFDQTQVLWFALLAMIGTATIAAREVSSARAHRAVLSTERLTALPAHHG